jgi:hypothetical protein
MTDRPDAIRDPGTGLFLSGNKTGGRKRLPDWFKDLGPAALKTLAAAALGEVVEGAPPAAVELAKTCSDRVRTDAAKTLIERVYGKVTDVVELNGEVGISEIRRIVVEATKKAPDDDDQP